MNIFKSIKSLFSKDINLPDKIFINNTWCYYKEDYNGHLWFCGYYTDKDTVPTVIKLYYVPFVENENYKRAKRLLYKKLDAARAFYNGIDEALKQCNL